MSPQPHEGPADEGFTCSDPSLDENCDGVPHAREMLSCFNHRCRNSLNGIKMSLYLLKREHGGPLPRNLGELERSYHRLEVFFDWLQMIYRPLSMTLVRSPLGRLFDERLPSWCSRFCTHGRTLELVPPPDDLPGDFDPMFLGVGLEAIVEWRAEACAANVVAVVSWRIRDGRFELRWEELRAPNGPPSGAREDATAQPSRPSPFPVDSLAHVLLRRIVAAHGGSLETAYAPSFVMTLRWPHLHVCRTGKCGSATDSVPTS